MEMRTAVPDWLTPIAWTYITLSLISGVVIAADIYLLGRRHRRINTELVWISAALYLGPFAIGSYVRHGRAGARSPSVPLLDDSKEGLGAVLPGGGASAVAHLAGVPIVAAAGWTIAGMAMWPMIIVIALLAIAMLAIHERTLGRDRAAGHTLRMSAGAALLAAVVTVAAFDVGMVGWMLLLHFNDWMPPVSQGTFWFLMQLGVLVGLLTGYPAVRWLLARQRSAHTLTRQATPRGAGA